MTTYNKLIKIQKMDINTEKWSDIYLSEKAEKENNPFIHANINKSSGKEYFNARVEISSSTFNFNIRYCPMLEDILYNTQIYRIVFLNKIFDIKTADNPQLNKHDLILVGELNEKYFA